MVFERNLLCDCNFGVLIISFWIIWLLCVLETRVTCGLSERP